MEVDDWLGLVATDRPHRFELAVVPRLSVGSRFLFGGCGLGAAVAAMEHVTGRPVVWATAQYLSYAPVGATVSFEVTEAVSGRATTQARVVGRVDDEEILTVNGALGRRDLDVDQTWPTVPEARPPETCPPRPMRHGDESVGDHLDQRWALAPDAPGPPGDDEVDPVAGPTGHGPGRVCLWASLPAGLDASAAALAVLGDWVPMGLASVTAVPVDSNSLDNTLRVLRVVPTRWFLLDIEPAGIRHGFGHGQLRVWSDQGELLAIASQSVLVRHRAPEDRRVPRRPDRR